MKLPKLKFDKATLQEFFFQHVEKIVLAVVVLLLGLFVWQGTQLERMKEEFDSPTKLSTITQTTKRKMDDPANWTTIAPERTVEANVRATANEEARQIAGTSYRPPRDFQFPIFPTIEPRLDPKAFPPTHLVVTALQGPLAIKRPQAAGELSGSPTALRNADPLSDTAPALATGGYPGGYGEAAPPALSGGSPKDKKSEKDAKKAERERKEKEAKDKAARDRPTTVRPKNGPKGPYESLEGDYGEYQYPSSPAATSTTAGRQFERDRGYVATADCTWETGRAVVVQAVVPWQKEFDEYRRCLENAVDFQPDRDLPRYLTYMVQRADVTANPDADPATLKWEMPVHNGRPFTAGVAQLETFRWHGFPAEILDSEYLDVELTHPAPPFMLRDLTAALTHPDIPVYSPEKALADAAAGQPQQQLYDAFGNPIEGSEDVVPTNPQMNQSNMRQNTAFMHKQPSVNQPGQPGGERGGYSPTMMNGATGTIEQIEQQIRPYKLIRFTDVTVVPGRVYRYRLKVVLEDPNHPKDPAREPAIASLHDTVKTRVKDVTTKEAAAAAKNPNKAARLYWIESDWSEASPTVSLPLTEHYYASAVQPPKTSPVRPDRPAAVAKDSSGKMVAVTWDKQHAVDVPVVVDIERGSAIQFQGEAQVIHPVEGMVRKISEFELSEAAVVADITGGEAILPQSLAKGTSLVIPGELLVFDENGNWHMLNEARNEDEIHRQILDPTLLGEEPEAAPTGPAGVRPPGPGPGPGPGRPPGSLPLRGSE